MFSSRYYLLSIEDGPKVRWQHQHPCFQTRVFVLPRESQLHTEYNCKN